MTKKNYDILGIGHALLDRIAAVEDDFLTSHNVPKGNVALIERSQMAALQKGLIAKEESSGGAVANCLVGAAQLGSKAVFIGRVGGDAHGKTFIADIKEQGVVFAGKTVSDDSGICLVLVTPDAQRSMITALSAAATLSHQDIDVDLIAQAKILYLEAYSWDSPAISQAAAFAAAQARRMGVKIALNLSDSLCVERHRAALAGFVNEIDILIANEAEICAFHQTADWHEAEAASLKMNIPIMALTRSEKGAVILDHGRVHKIDALAVDQLTDTTGAGDLYAAGFLHAIAQGQTAFEGGQLGAKMAAEIIQIYGARLHPDFSL